jgi:osmotically-inducible protein OsmY
MKTPKEWMEDIVTDHDLVQGARTALENDRSIGHVGSVDVSAEGGLLTITGTVYSRAQKWAVEHVVRRAVGATRVVSYLNVDPPKAVSHGDQEIADAAATVLRSTIGAPDGVEVSVLNGRAMLEGTVASPAEQRLAADLVCSLVGVNAVDNRLVVAPGDTTPEH